MAIQIKCNQCGNLFELDEALQHQIQESAIENERAKTKLLIEEARKEGENKATQKAKQDFELQLKKSQEETNEEHDRVKNLQNQVLELTKAMRDSRREVDDVKLEAAKKLAEDEGKIREDVRKKVEEEHSLKEREINTKLQAALKLNEQLNQKLEQGSQQAQGESLEVEVEEILRKEFPGDIITEVAKGVRGADTLQRVIDKHSRECGSILWESKNAKWSSAWLGKLREDQRNAKAQMGVLVSVNLPDDIKSFTFREGVWVTNRSSVVGLAWALRINIAQLYSVKQMSEGKHEKMEELFRYLTGVEFRQRVEAIVEGFTNLQGDIEKEKRWFQVKWANQEKEIRKIIDSTHGMYGDLQGVTGRSLPEIKGLQLTEPATDA